MLWGIRYAGGLFCFLGWFLIIIPPVFKHYDWENFRDVFVFGVGSLPYGMTFGAVTFVTGMIIMLLSEIVSALRGQEPTL